MKQRMELKRLLELSPSSSVFKTLKFTSSLRLLQIIIFFKDLNQNVQSICKLISWCGLGVIGAVDIIQGIQDF